jgi:hypothetical protein
LKMILGQQRFNFLQRTAAFEKRGTAPITVPDYSVTLSKRTILPSIASHLSPSADQSRISYFGSRSFQLIRLNLFPKIGFIWRTGQRTRHLRRHDLLSKSSAGGAVSDRCPAHKVGRDEGAILHPKHSSILLSNSFHVSNSSFARVTPFPRLYLSQPASET